jgi:hypothetical protein
MNLPKQPKVMMILEGNIATRPVIFLVHKIASSPELSITYLCLEDKPKLPIERRCISNIFFICKLVLLTHIT